MLVDVPSFEDYMENLTFDLSNVVDRRVFIQKLDVERDPTGCDRDITLAITCLIASESYNYILQYARILGRDSTHGEDATDIHFQTRQRNEDHLKSFCIANNLTLLPGKLEQF